MDSSRPSDHIDADHIDADAPADSKITQPKLGFVGYVRFFWRQLTSMRTALFLLLLLAIAAIPGSLVPQKSSDPNGVIQYRAANPELSDVLDALGVFNTYTSVWFSAIYLLLFLSLIGCVIPRTKHHLEALRAKPPKTPADLSRLPAYVSRETTTDAGLALDEAERMLRSQRYRVQRFDGSISAERGYLRETGNLVFHSALIGVLVAVGIGGGFGYSGQRVIVEGQAFVNSLASYDSFNPGRFFTDSALSPYRIQLDSFEATYEEDNFNAYGQPTDFVATVTTTERGGEPKQGQIKVNEPLSIAGTTAYLLGNGYAPHLVVRDPDGTAVFSQPVAFLPQDQNLFSLGIIKVPDGLDQQLGIRALLYPTTFPLANGTFSSSHPDLRDPSMSLEVYAGDLGLDGGRATNAYALDVDDLTQLAGRDAPEPTIRLTVGQVADLPDGLGTIELVEIPRFVSLDIHHDPSQFWVALFSALVVAGLIASLFVARRRVWIKVVDTDGVTALQYAGLARGDDPRLEQVVGELADRHNERLKVDE
ncbi:cytochrome c biogenesis protein [Microbacteriaceae bacterium SG_E_30_P1]|uniref:Cytochrome c biogenesis protein n=1 Tax=Antiquaquibacter oligotrophicus TaxID=2880260 RepID=A0ABT6KPV6_9MICO|nr:cytochrome c biogenesis protein ResB [Antiquaquibacter oligotrophicus]MDH6182025.1 cytochrome c biogenesis protein [Antiquaquibacter oligotrophicus]UDF12307.1 cytochrome c biogenesis protein ResB [Antiquaquibacter oligotrophicus]